MTVEMTAVAEPPS